MEVAVSLLDLLVSLATSRELEGVGRRPGVNVVIGGSISIVLFVAVLVTVWVASR